VEMPIKPSKLRCDADGKEKRLLTKLSYKAESSLSWNHTYY